MFFGLARQLIMLFIASYWRFMPHSTLKAM